MHFAYHNGNVPSVCKVLGARKARKTASDDSDPLALSLVDRLIRKLFGQCCSVAPILRLLYSWRRRQPKRVAAFCHDQSARMQTRVCPGHERGREPAHAGARWREKGRTHCGQTREDGTPCHSLSKSAFASMQRGAGHPVLCLLECRARLSVHEHFFEKIYSNFFFSE